MTHASTVQRGFTGYAWWHHEAETAASPGDGRAVLPVVPGAGVAVPTDARKATVRRFGRSHRRAQREPPALRVGPDRPADPRPGAVAVPSSARVTAEASPSRKARAACRSGVLHPSLNPPNAAASSRQPSASSPRSRSRRDGLSAARHASDFPPCRRATARARRKHASAAARPDRSGSWGRAAIGSAEDGPGVWRAVLPQPWSLPNTFLCQGMLRAVPSPVTPRPRNLAGPAYHPLTKRNESASSFVAGRPRGGSSRRLRGRWPALR